MRDVLDMLCTLASRNRLTLIHYLKPGERDHTERVVEPYRLQESAAENLMVQCWQVKPVIEDWSKWRNFRLDRIIHVSDGGGHFNPRCPVTIHQGEVEQFEWGHHPAQTLGPAATYFKYIEDAMLDGRVSPKEIEQARTLGQAVPIEERRGCHAQVFSNVLQEVLQDLAVSDREVRYLAGVAKFLHVLGWAPGAA